MKSEFLPDVKIGIEAVKPLGDFVLVQRLPDNDMYSDLVIMAPKDGKHAMAPQRGLVLRCGPGDKIRHGRAPMHVAAGQTVLYNRAPANTVSLNGEEYTFLHEEQHILAVLEP